jgi:hypothetical protein
MAEYPISTFHDRARGLFLKTEKVKLSLYLDKTHEELEEIATPLLALETEVCGQLHTPATLLPAN